MVAALRNNYILSSVFFCASLNHKQMSLYYAPAIFAHLFGSCLKQKTLARKVSKESCISVTHCFNRLSCHADHLVSPFKYR
jgi:alpha-1,3-glucosyltransferase